jgi:hypothetical protein
MTTYAELCVQASEICENEFSPDQLAMFFRTAEQKIYNTVQIPALRKNVTGTMTAGNKYLAIPTDFLYVFSMAVVGADGAYEFLLDKDVNFIREAYPFPLVSGKPRHYALFDANSFILGPTPDAAFEVELHYGYYPESIVTAGTTWLGDEFDSALLNGALVEAIRFMKGEQDMVQLYSELFLQSMSLLKNLGDGKLRQDAYRSGQNRVKVQ